MVDGEKGKRHNHFAFIPDIGLVSLDKIKYRWDEMRRRIRSGSI